MSIETQAAPTSQAAPDVGYPIYDADQHYYEPVDCLSRHLDPKYRGIVRWADIGGRKTVLINGRQLTVVPNPTYDPVAEPGSLETYFRSQNVEGKELRDMVRMHSIQPEYRNRDERIKRLDEQGVEQTWLLPSFGLGIEEIARSLGADSLGFISEEGMITATAQPEEALCTACFSGKYPVALPEPIARAQGITQAREAEPAVVGKDA